MHVISILSQSHLPSFKLSKLKSILGDNLSCSEIYLINSSLKLSSTSINKLEQLLNGSVIDNIKLDNNNCLVTPRLGTVSPWSSKATEIIRQCRIKIMRIERCLYYQSSTISLNGIYEYIHDPMTESILNKNNIYQLFNQRYGDTYTSIDILSHGEKILDKVNHDMGLVLENSEVKYLYNSYLKLGRNPTDIEVMMFAQANSEHCRHKIFNANFIINGIPQNKSMFALIKDTYYHAPKNVLVAYHDNSSVINGDTWQHFYPNSATRGYHFNQETSHILMKVETHNHPTAIYPFAGAATGAGGEIRDEGATGRGAKPKAGLSGFSVSYLDLPGHQFRSDIGTPVHIKNALNIMLDAPIGSASFNNEFGRPTLCGYFRSFEQKVNNIYYGYHKPIMIAGGYGNISNINLNKNQLPVATIIIQLGGPGFLIGLGGGSSSSMANGDNNIELDFNSVQRSNPEMQRRCQEVINRCCELGIHNPILSIHDVGAGGLSNAIPELIHKAQLGAMLQLRAIPIDDNSMSPLEIWCNESQERYVVAIDTSKLLTFEEICKRENCPYAVLGNTIKEQKLIITDDKFGNTPININMAMLFDDTPTTTKNVTYEEITAKDTFDSSNIDTVEALYKILSHPTVGSKSFLITIGDRTVGGYTARDQLIGKWQIPVANCAITTLGYNTHKGEAMAIGERPPIAIINTQAAAKMAIAESITNICSCYIPDISDIKLSANWMASCGSTNQDSLLYYAVKSASQMCQALNIAIPVGKDSLSMRTSWKDNLITKEIIAPISLVVSAFAVIPDVRKHKTPLLIADTESSLLLLTLDQQQRIGASIFQECYDNIGGNPANIDNDNSFANLIKLVSNLHQLNLIMSYHDRSDGGIATTLCEMLFASRIGIKLNLNTPNINDFLFNEETGIVVQVSNKNLLQLQTMAKQMNIIASVIGVIDIKIDNFVVINNNEVIIDETRIKLQYCWSQTSYSLQKLRDNPLCADDELATIKENNYGLFSRPNFDLASIQNFVFPMLNLCKPKVAILRAQGTNGHMEMAASFVKVGFDAIDVHLSDLISGAANLNDFCGLVMCGGFSYGDVLGAGIGVANQIIFNYSLKQKFSQFFKRHNTFTLGVCNGCQILSHLSTIIPDGENFPVFKRNHSEQFEARLVMVDIPPSPSVLLQDMTGSQLPIVVSHGEGRADFSATQLITKCNIAMRYIDSHGNPTTTYPYNPNGSPQGITGVTNNDGRVTLIMPHPERVIRNVQMSWYEDISQEMSPWFKLFINARQFVG